MFPQFVIGTNISTETEEREQGKTFVFVFDKKQHKIVDGKMLEATEIQSVKQWITKLIMTEADTFEIYTEDEEETYGLHLKQYIGNRALPLGYISSEIEREIREQCKKHSLISRISNFNITQNQRSLLISFDVFLISGETLRIEQEVS